MITDLPAADLPAQFAADLGAVQRPGIDLWGLYTAKEAAAYLRLAQVKGIYDIPETDLPRRRIGPNRGAHRWMGADLFCYALGMEPVPMERIMQDFREAMRRPVPSVQSLHTERPGKRRVL
jgi:hypothetical protein